ncbi:DUF4259 domain-containing protein [Microlunatus flavus]|uniref:DUF4259 domain-containing protein n=1 Tax=Microlunatus flavus TaxID=1036181 RepID=A0A1H9A7L9_9ACTN|nr:DUF4259 domain-containing protein [Microlunatus flavus]SEP72443.1 protein of unknown function [Microlunatus flavus]
MGAWGNGPFDNDDALDLLGELGDSDRPLADELRNVLDPTGGRRPRFWARLLRRPSEQDSSDEMNDFTVVAAAAVVAAGLGLDTGEDQVRELLANKPLRVGAEPRSSARAALARATGPESEWFELWQESGELDRTQAEVDRVRRLL